MAKTSAPVSSEQAELSKRLAELEMRAKLAETNARALDAQMIQTTTFVS